MLWLTTRVLKQETKLLFNVTRTVSIKSPDTTENTTIVNNVSYSKDHMSNVTPKILSHLDRHLHLQKHHPLNLIKQRIVNYMYERYKQNRGMPTFSVHEQIPPVVTLDQNFDSLLVPKDHVSRTKSDSYYLNSSHMLRAHTSAHQSDLIKMGLDNFLVVGDVYRRDEIDSTHYPVFHQMEGVRLLGGKEICKMSQNPDNDIKMFENSERNTFKQGVHTYDAAKILEVDLKNCLSGLAQHLFGEKIEYRWVDCYFPFTHPSWELEVFYKGDWLEVLGCGVMEQEILVKAGVEDKVGWAFGLGLERLAMVLYSIPDIRLFWSRDTGFLSQFSEAGPDTKIVYKDTSKFPQCVNDISFWLPKAKEGDELFSPNDFYDLVRDIGGDLVEQVKLVDEFTHPKKGLSSQSYRIVYRDMSKTLTQEEANVVHKAIEAAASDSLGVTIR